MPLIKFDSKTDSSSTLVKWDSSYSVGITEIDQQHQMLISMINELNDSMVQGKGRDALEKVLDGLASYTKEHFATEEKLFDKYAYPWSITHKAEHQAFAQRVTTLNQEYKQGKFGLPYQLLNSLSDWLKNHIIGKDKTYSYFFVMKGLQ